MAYSARIVLEFIFWFAPSLIPGSLAPKAAVLANSAPVLLPGMRSAHSTMFGEAMLSVRDEGLQLIRSLCFSET